MAKNKKTKKRVNNQSIITDSNVKTEAEKITTEEKKQKSEPSTKSNMMLIFYGVFSVIELFILMFFIYATVRLYLMPY